MITSVFILIASSSLSKLTFTSFSRITVQASHLISYHFPHLCSLCHYHIPFSLVSPVCSVLDKIMESEFIPRLSSNHSFPACARTKSATRPETLLTRASCCQGNLHLQLERGRDSSLEANLRKWDFTSLVFSTSWCDVQEDQSVSRYHSFPSTY